jgi:hypothetical protein
VSTARSTNRRSWASFPTCPDDTLILPKRIEAAQKRSIEHNRRPRLAWDIARFGEDETVGMRREGGWIRLYRAHHKAYTMTTTGHIAKAMRDIDAEADKNDCTGAGRSCGTAYSVDGRFCSSSRCVGGKSGTGWGCTQLFKLLGQKEYLGAGHAVFVASACDPTRVDRADARFRHLDLHALHVPGPVMTAGHWALWQRLADRGLIATAVPPTAAAVAAATRAANRRRLAEDTLRRAVRDPGYSTVFANAAHLIKAIDDVGMTLADPGARLLAVWAMRDRWWQSGQDAAEEEALAARRGLAMAIASSPKLGLQ